MDPITAAVGAIAYQFSANIQAILEYIILMLIPRINCYRIPNRIESRDGNTVRNDVVNVVLDTLRKGKYLYTLNGKPHGVVIGKWYLARVDDNGITIYCTAKYYEQLTEHHKVLNSIRTGIPNNNYGGGFQYSNELCRQYTLSKGQKRAVEHIIKNMNTIGAFWIYGPPGTGKSTLAKYLAEKLNKTLMRDINIFKHDLNLGNCIYSYDEIDGLLRSQFAVEPVKGTPPNDVKNKWCGALDRFKDQVGAIFIMTANVHPREIECINEAYYRPGRLALIELKKPITNVDGYVKPVSF